MNFDTPKFFVGFTVGSLLIFLSVNQSILYGSIVMGLLVGLLHEGYQKNPHYLNKEKSK